MTDSVNRTGIEKASDAAVESSGRPSASRSEPPPRVALWRAMAGMAVALALACSIVAVEISRQLAGHTSRYVRRVAALSEKVRALQREAAVKEKRLAAARREIAARGRLGRILLAPDLKTIRLVPAAPSDSGVSASVEISRTAGGAVLNAAGLAALPDGQVYGVWWMLKGKPPAKAGEFRAAQDDAPTAYLDLPPAGETVAACVVTLESAAGGTRPGGPVKLKGRLTAPR